MVATAPATVLNGPAWNICIIYEQPHSQFKLLNSDASDRAQIDSLIEEYFLEEVTDESEADDDEDDNNANYITDKTTISTFVRMITTQHGYTSP